MEQKKKSKSRELYTRLMYATLDILNKNDGQLSSPKIEELIEKTLELDEWDCHPYKGGGFRWLSYLHFYSIDLVKAGFIIKNKGVWYLTDAGKDALSRYDADELYEVAHKAYLDWDRARQKVAGSVRANEDPDNSVHSFDDIKAQADDEIMQYIHSKTPYEFQDMAAALFRAMGYYTPFIAPRGKDGGIDIIAYSDPLGATKPILKVQVKHYTLDNPVTVDVIRSIVGVAKDDVAVVVTSGRFAEPSKTEARQYNVRLIDGFEFSDLWTKYYNKMTEEDKARMPIEPIYFIKRNE